MRNAFILTFRLKLRPLDEQSLYGWKKGFVNQIAIPAKAGIQSPTDDIRMPTCPN